MNKKKTQPPTTPERDLFTVENTTRSMYAKTDSPLGNKGEVAIINPTYMKEHFHREYVKPEYQLFRLKSGFGCYPDTLGNACIGHFCADGEACRLERYDFIGIADEETTAYANALELVWDKTRKSAV